MYYNLFDSHIHSHNSPDGTDSAIFLAESAVSRGLSGIAVTDHCEQGQYREENIQSAIFHMAMDAAKAKYVFRKSLSFSGGLELGLGWEAAERAITRGGFDFLLGALHDLPGEQPLYCLDYGAMTRAETVALMERYFDALAGVIGKGGFDSLAHMTLPVRYIRQYAGILPELEQFGERIERILKALIEKGIALELNTSGLRSACGDFMPPPWVVKRYRELGGELVTIGSDAHCADEVGKGIVEGMELLEQAGFRYFAFYRKREPIMLRLI